MDTPKSKTSIIPRDHVIVLNSLTLKDLNDKVYEVIKSMNEQGFKLEGSQYSFTPPSSYQRRPNDYRVTQENHSIMLRFKPTKED